MKLAILATVLRPLSHEMPHGLGHAADWALKRFASRIVSGSPSTSDLELRFGGNS
jgi:hypothetical protein